MDAPPPLDGTRESYRAFVESIPPTVVTSAVAKAPEAASASAQPVERDRRVLDLANAKPRGHRTFDAAVMTRLSADWTFSPLSADAEIRQNFRNLRARSRDLERNDSYGEHHLALAEQNVIGSSGIGLQMKVTRPNRGRNDDGESVPVLDTPTNQLIERLWRVQCRRKNYCVTRDQNATAADKLILRSTLRDGDLLVRKIRGYPNETGFAVQILEGDYLDDTYTDFRAVACQCPSQFGLPLCQGGTHEIRMGVELQGDWKFPVAYWLLGSHPGDYMVGTAVYAQPRIRVDVREIIHPFIKKRPGQTRGYPAIACAMLRLHMLGGYAEAELVAARAAAQKMGFIESEVPETLFDEYFDPETGRADIDAEPGEIEELPVGKHFKEWDPTHPNQNFPGFNKEQLRGVAAGLNVSYTSLSGNIEDVNFSSMRGGLLEEREGWKGLQTWFIQEVKREIFESWLEWQILCGRAPGLQMSRWDDYIDETAVVWKPRRWPWVDPFKDAQANDLNIKNNLTTKSAVIAETGEDLEQVLAERSYETKLEKKLGIAPIDPDAPGAAAAGDQEDEEEGDDDVATSTGQRGWITTDQGNHVFIEDTLGVSAHPSIGKEGKWSDLGLPTAKEIPAIPRPRRISQQKAMAKLSEPYAVEDQLGHAIGFGSRLRQHLQDHLDKPGGDKKRPEFLPHMEKAVSHAAEIWSENTDKGPRLKHVIAYTSSKGRRSFAVISHQIGETTADVVTGTPKEFTGINKMRTGKLLYVAPR